jgi:hypothetical protein
VRRQTATYTVSSIMLSGFSASIHVGTVITDRGSWEKNARVCRLVMIIITNLRKAISEYFAVSGSLE